MGLNLPFCYLLLCVSYFKISLLVVFNNLISVFVCVCVCAHVYAYLFWGSVSILDLLILVFITYKKFWPLMLQMIFCFFQNLIELESYVHSFFGLRLLTAFFFINCELFFLLFILTIRNKFQVMLYLLHMWILRGSRRLNRTELYCESLLLFQYTLCVKFFHLKHF